MWIMTCWLRTTSRVRTYGDAAIVTHLSTGEKAVNRFPSALWACHPGIKPITLAPRQLPSFPPPGEAHRACRRVMQRASLCAE